MMSVSFSSSAAITSARRTFGTGAKGMLLARGKITQLVAADLAESEQRIDERLCSA